MTGARETERLDRYLWELIEELGGLVVGDDLCSGSRYFWDLVDEDGDPLAVLARRYIFRAPCARMRPSTRRIEHLKGLAEQYRVEGIILVGLKFCDLYGGDYLLVTRGLEETGLPLLRLEREYVLGGGAGQVKTRV
jgi:benzoyl-CoA reductase subunit C